LELEDVTNPNTLVTFDQYDFAYTGQYQSYTRTENSGMRYDMRREMQ